MLLKLVICLCLLHLGKGLPALENGEIPNGLFKNTKLHTPTESNVDESINSEDEHVNNDQYTSEEKFQNEHHKPAQFASDISQNSEDVMLQRKSLPFRTPNVRYNINQAENIGFPNHYEYLPSQYYQYGTNSNRDMYPFQGSGGLGYNYQSNNKQMPGNYGPGSLSFNYQMSNKQTPGSDYLYTYPSSSSGFSPITSMTNPGGQNPYNTYLNFRTNPSNTYSNSGQMFMNPYQESGSNNIYPDMGQFGNSQMAVSQYYANPSNIGSYDVNNNRYPNQFLTNSKPNNWQMPISENARQNIYPYQFSDSTYQNLGQYPENFYTGLNSGQFYNPYINSGQSFPSSGAMNSNSGQIPSNYFNSGMMGQVYPNAYSNSPQTLYNAQFGQTNLNRNPNLGSNSYPENGKVSGSDNKNSPNVQFFFQGKPISKVFSGNDILDSNHQQNNKNGLSVESNIQNGFPVNGNRRYNTMGQRNPYDQSYPWTQNPNDQFFIGAQNPYEHIQTSGPINPYEQFNSFPNFVNNPYQFQPFYQGNSRRPTQRVKYSNYPPSTSALNSKEPMFAKTTLKIRDKAKELKNSEMSELPDNTNDELQDEESDEYDTSEQKHRYNTRKQS